MPLKGEVHALLQGQGREPETLVPTLLCPSLDFSTFSVAGASVAALAALAAIAAMQATFMR